MSAEASGCRTKGWARIPTMGVVASAAERGGKYDKNLAVNHTDWKVGVSGPMLYHATLVILREGGRYSLGRKIDSRGTSGVGGGGCGGGCGSMTGNENEEWETMHIDDWFLALKVGIESHVFVSIFGTFGSHMGINREHEGMAHLRIGTSGNHSAINIMRATSNEILGNLDLEGYHGDNQRISGEIHGPSFGYLRGSPMEYRGKTIPHVATWCMGICAL